MTKGIERLSQQPRSLLVTSGILLVGLFGCLDYVTGSELAAEVFYLIPIALVTWTVGPWQGYLICVLSAVALFAADAMCSPHYTHPIVPYWNVLVRFGLFLLVSRIIGFARVARRKRKDLLQRIQAERSAIAEAGAGGISEKNQARKREQELQQRLARVERVEMLSVQASSIAHDLNNLVLPIAKLPDVVLQDLDKCAETDTLRGIREDVVAIRNSARSAMNLIRNMLVLGRRGNCDFHRADLNDVVEEYLSSAVFRSLASGQSDIVFEKRLSLDLSPINGSRTHLLEVIMNLMGNAYESIPGKGRVTLTTANERLENDFAGFEVIPKGDYAILRVADTGVGIAGDILHRIFEPFFSRKTMNRNGGTGLGLAIVHGVVKDHKGFIHVRSVVGKGTEFVLFFPHMRSSEGNEGFDFSTHARDERLLIVDDDEDRLMLTRRFLEREGYRVTACHNGWEVIEILKESAEEKMSDRQTHSFDLVVIRMEGEKDVDGLGLCRRILGIEADQKCLVVGDAGGADEAADGQMPRSIGFVRATCSMEELGVVIQERWIHREEVADLNS